ncbi:MAG: hypothetical protein Q4B26_02870, partial [Eubacteriales bacterium]|nr:hypothetical protein [Eubacteriales bacterium]
MKSIRDVFCSLEEYRGCQMVTVLEGENAGEKGIRSEKEILFAEGDGISCIWEQIPQDYQGVL